jgi:hypothetical protein
VGGLRGVVRCAAKSNQRERDAGKNNYQTKETMWAQETG